MYNETFRLIIAPIYRRRIVIDVRHNSPRDATLSNKKW